MKRNSELSLPGSDPKRWKILRCAARAVAREGFERAHLDQIAADAGVAKATIYGLFANRKALLREAIKVTAVEMSAPLKSALDPLLPLKAALPEYVQRYVGRQFYAVADDCPFFRLSRAILEGAARSPEIALECQTVFEENIHRPLSASFAARQAIGDVRTDVDAGVLAQVLISMIFFTNSTIITTAASPTEGDMIITAMAATAVFLGGCGPER